MPHCPNCGNRVKAVHHYCGSCGQALSDIAERESDPPMAIERDGFLSHRSIEYISELLAEERELNYESVSYTQLCREVNAAFADFSRLALIDDLNLLHLWATGSDSNALKKSVDDMNSNQFQDFLGAIGLGRTLRMYDAALQTEFEDEFNDQLQNLHEQINDESRD